jgi:hypothetical protein
MLDLDQALLSAQLLQTIATVTAVHAGHPSEIHPLTQRAIQ